MKILSLVIAVLLIIAAFIIGRADGLRQQKNASIDQRLITYINLYNQMESGKIARMSNNLGVIIYSIMQHRDEQIGKSNVADSFKETYLRGDAIRRQVGSNIMTFNAEELKTFFGGKQKL